MLMGQIPPRFPTACRALTAWLCVLPLLAGCGARTPEEKRGRFLMDELHGTQPERRMDAARELGRMRYRPAIPELRKLLRDVRPNVRTVAAESLGAMGVEEAVAPLSELLKSPEWATRRTAALALAAIGKPAIVGPLESALHDENGSVAMAAAMGLARLGDAGLAPLRASATNQNAALRHATVFALAREGAAGAVPILRGALRDPASQVRVEALRGVTRIEGKRALDLAADLITHPERAMTEVATNLLVQAGADAMPALARVLSGDNAAARIAAVGLLLRIGSPEAIRSAVLVLRDPNPQVRAAVSRALRARLDPLDLRTLALQAIPDSAGDFRRELLALLGDAVDASLLGLARTLAGDPEPSTRQVAVRWLIRIGNESARSALAERLADADPRIRHAAAAALAKSRVPAALDVLAQQLRAASAPTGQRPPDDQAIAALRLLSEAGDARLGDLLIPLLAADSSALRLAAIRTLGEKRNTAAVPGLVALLKEPGDALRSEVVTALGAIGDRRATEHLTALLADPDKARAAHAARALGKLRDPRATDALIERLSHADPAMRSAALMALGDSGDPRAFGVLLPLLDRTDRIALAEAAEALGRLRDPRGFEPLSARFRAAWAAATESLKTDKPSYDAVLPWARALGYLGDERALDLLAPMAALITDDPMDKGRVRVFMPPSREAIDAVARIGGAKAFDIVVNRIRISQRDPSRFERYYRPHCIDQLFRMDPDRALTTLSELLLTEPLHSIEQIAGYCRRLGASDDPRVVKPLLFLMLTDLPENRINAINTLMDMGDAIVDELIRQMDGDSAPRRSGIAIVLGEIGGTAPAKLAAALTHASPGIRQGAAWALGHAGAGPFVEPLLKALQDPSADVRGAAAWALGQSRDRRALAPLLALLKDADPLARDGAAFALGQLGEGSALPHLLAALHDDHARVRSAAAAGLGRMGDRQALPALRQALADGNADVRTAVQGAIEAIENPKPPEPTKPWRRRETPRTEEADL